MDQWLKHEADTKIKLENATINGIERGKNIVRDETDAKIRKLEQEAKDLRQENFDLQLLSKEPQKCIERE